MPSRKAELLTALRLDDPWSDTGVAPATSDLQGWNSAHPFLIEAADEEGPLTIVDLGVWKGASSIAMAERLRAKGIDGVVVAVDTFLGSAEHYLNRDWKQSLQIVGGYPRLYDSFAANVRTAGLQDYVVPIPLDSVNAAVLLASAGVQVDAVHIDAAHDFDSVARDLRLWFDLLKMGGTVICDDYNTLWPGVVAAVDHFTRTHAVTGLVAQSDKCRFHKPSSGAHDDAISTSDDERLAQALRERSEAYRREADLARELSAIHGSRAWRWTQRARSLVRRS